MPWIPELTYKMSDDDLEAAAAHWESLADEQEYRLLWDRHSKAEIVESRAALYRQTAKEIRTGIGKPS